MVHVAVVTRASSVIRRLAVALDTLRWPYHVIEPSPGWRPKANGGPIPVVHCLDSDVAGGIDDWPEPAVILLCGARVPDQVLPNLQRPRIKMLSVVDLTSHRLLTTLIAAILGSRADGLTECLQGFEPLRDVDDLVIHGFLTNPPRMVRLTDLRRSLMLSRERAQARVRACGFDRAEHLFTALRIATWVLLNGEGLPRREIERYLGIYDRGSFRRACVRAGLPTLHRNLRQDAFETMRTQNGITSHSRVG